MTEATRSTRERPQVVTWITGIVIAAAVLNACIGLLLVVQIPNALVQVAARAQQQHVRPPADGVVIASLVAAGGVAVLYGAILILLVLRLRAGRAWARSALFAATVLSLFALFGLNGPALAVIVLLVAADFLMFRPRVTAWLRHVRGLPPV